MTSWSDLANDALELLTGFLPLADRHRFSAVCQSWRSVAEQKRHPPAPELPWLVLGEDNKTKKRNFFNVSEQKLYSIDIPELYGHHVCGSSFGWLFTVDERVKGRLVNPFTRQCYELPPYPRYGGVDDPTTLTDEPVFDSEGNQFGWTFKEMQSRIVHKAVLTHDPNERSDFTAMIVYGEYCALAIWRPGDEAWTLIKPKMNHDLPTFSDIVCFKGRLYASSYDNAIFALDTGCDPKIKRITKSPKIKSVPIWNYLVNFKGSLLLVLRFQKTRDHGRTSNFLVFRINLRKRTFLKKGHIYNHSLFVGNNSTVVVDSSKFPGCIENCIYFTDMCESVYWQDLGHDYGVYDVVQKTMRDPFCPDEDAFCPPEATLTWLTPNP